MLEASSLFLLLVSLALFGLVLPFVFVPRIIRRASDWGILDLPDRRKLHAKPTPRLGGLSIVPAFWIGLSAALVCSLGSYPFSMISFEPGFSNVVIGLFIGVTGSFFLGAIDDLRRLDASKKILVQSLIALLTVPFLPIPDFILQIGLNAFSFWVIAFVWLVVLPNSVNLLDGVDGLTTSLVLLVLSVFSGLAVFRGELGWLFVTVPVMASLASFLRFNWGPAKIFLGDSGSLMLGFSLAYLAIVFATFTSAEGVTFWNLGLSALFTSVWLLDTGLAILRRYWVKRPPIKVFFRRSKRTYLYLQQEALKNICSPDRMHLHHRLMTLGMPSSQVVLVILSILLTTLAGAIPVFVLGTEGRLASASMWGVGLATSSVVMAYLFVSQMLPRLRAQHASLHHPVKKSGSDDQIAA